MIDLSKIVNFILLFLVNKKRFHIWKKKNIYNIIVIHKNLLINKIRKVDKKVKLLFIITQ